MLLRSLVVSTILAGQMAVGSASAQIILCPKAPPANIDSIDTAAETERLLQRLSVALDLHGYRGISDHDIEDVHTEAPNALLAKLSNVVDRCSKASGDLKTFYQTLPELREAFLEATGIAYAADNGDAEKNSSAIRTVALEPPGGETAESLLIRDLWRKLWFRSAESVDKKIGRWAVIVASPEDVDSGWEKLGEHQRRWKDAYFQLHVPYYEINPHHAIVVGRRLPHDQAVRLRDYAIELGMAEDAYVWPLPVDEIEETVSVSEKSVSQTNAEPSVDSETRPKDEDGLDLSILNK